MNGNSVFLDTNIIIYILSWNRKYIDLFIWKNIYVSVISELEVLSYNFINEKEEQIAKKFFENVNIIEISYIVKDLVYIIRKRYKIKLPDSIILATSLYLGLNLETEDIKLKNIFLKIKNELN